MSVRPDSRSWTSMSEPVCAGCAHGPGLLASLAKALPPLPFAMCFSAAEERPGGILALPDGFRAVVGDWRSPVSSDPGPDSRPGSPALVAAVGAVYRREREVG